MYTVAWLYSRKPNIARSGQEHAQYRDKRFSSFLLHPLSYVASNSGLVVRVVNSSNQPIPLHAPRDVANLYSHHGISRKLRSLRRYILCTHFLLHERDRLKARTPCSCLRIPPWVNERTTGRRLKHARARQRRHQRTELGWRRRTGGGHPQQDVRLRRWLTVASMFTTYVYIATKGIRRFG